MDIDRLKVHNREEYFIQLKQLFALENTFEITKTMPIEEIFKALEVFEQYALVL